MSTERTRRDSRKTLPDFSPDAAREKMLNTAAVSRKQFRSQSVASSDPRSPYFTNYWLNSGKNHINRSPSVACVPQYDASSTELRNFRDGERKKRGRKGNIPGLNLTLSPSDPKASTIHQHYYPEGGWGWIVMCCALIFNIVASAMQISVGFFVLEIRNQFLQGKNSLEPVVVVAVSSAISLLLSPIVVALCKRKSIRLLAIFGGIVTSLGCLFTSFASQLHQLYLSCGLFIGSGDCLARETATIIVGQYFKKRRQEVEMIFLMGYGVGIATIPLLFSYWIRTLGWRRGLQILAGLQTVTCFVAVLYRPASLYHPQRRAILHIKSLQKRSKAKDKTPVVEKRPFLDFSVLKSKTVQILIFASGITAFGMTSPFTLLVEEMKRDELDMKSIYQVQINLGIAISLGTAAFGLIVIKNSVQCMIAKQYLCQAAGFFLSGWFLAYPTLTGFYGYILFVWIYGIFYGGYIYSFKLCVFEKVRARNYARTWSFLQWSQAVPGFIGIPVIYHLNEVLGSKRGYYISAAVVFLGSMSLFFIDMHKSHIRKQKQLELETNAEAALKRAADAKRLSQDTLGEIPAPREYGDLRKAQELTCVSEEMLVENCMEDYIDDCITSCNKEEKFLMLSEFENNLFKTDETLEKGSTSRDYHGNAENCHYCPVCSRNEEFRATDRLYSPRKMLKAISSIDVIDEVTSL